MHKVNTIFIEIPIWLGDAVMATPAIKNLQKTYPNAKFIILGSFASVEIFKETKNVQNLLVNDTKKAKHRYLALYHLAKSIGSVDLAISFRRSFSSKFMMFFIDAKQKFNYKKLTKKITHQAKRYNDFVNFSLNLNHETDNLYLTFKAHTYQNPTLGINPGAAYGSAKRWYPKEFAKIALMEHKNYDIIIFGGRGEEKEAKEIEDFLIQNKVKNYTNLAGKTSVKELCQYIGGLSMLITNDSGPMHIAAAYQVPTYAIIGPTTYAETYPWNNPNGHIITKDLPCAPCTKRVCPLKHHECMKSITAEDVVTQIKKTKTIY